MEIKKSLDGMVSFNPKNNRISFIQSKQYLKSISALIKTIKRKVDSEELAIGVAAKKKKSVQEVLKEWEDKKQDSIQRGLRVHSYLEDKLGGVEVKTSCKSTKQAKKFYKDFILSGRLTPLNQEQVVYYKNVYGGILDADFNTTDGKLVLVDFKTNEELNDKYYDTFKPPLNTIGASKMAEYTLQLNLLAEAYSFCIGIEPDYLYIVHITEDDYSLIGVNNIRDTVEFKKLIADDYSRT